jgi:hypothetical protein
MSVVLFMGFVMPPAWSAPPEAVDADFLDYLATVEGKDDNWTVVASDHERQKVPREARPADPKDKKPPDSTAKPEEVKP